MKERIITLDGISVGQILDVYDDGKMTPSRRYNADILEFIPASEINGDLEMLWDYNRNEYPHLYSEDQDYFIMAKTNEHKDFPVSYFARTTDGGWFSMGVLRFFLDEIFVDNMFNAGRLITKTT